MSIRLKILLCILSLEVLAIVFLLSYKSDNCTTSVSHSYTTEQGSERTSCFGRQYNGIYYGYDLDDIPDVVNGRELSLGYKRYLQEGHGPGCDCTRYACFHLNNIFDGTDTRSSGSSGTTKKMRQSLGLPF